MFFCFVAIKWGMSRDLDVMICPYFITYLKPLTPDSTVEWEEFEDDIAITDVDRCSLVMVVTSAYCLVMESGFVIQECHSTEVRKTIYRDWTVSGLRWLFWCVDWWQCTSLHPFGESFSLCRILLFMLFMDFI